MKELLLKVEDLKTHFFSEGTEIHAVDGVDFELHRGEVLGLVGESGSGKSVTARSIMGLITPPGGRIVGGRVLFDGANLLAKTEKEMQRIRGNEIGMIFQEPMTSLNPVFKIGDQIMEAILLHKKTSHEMARQRAIEMLDLVRIPNAKQRIDDYPHQLSGGMRQRVMIAMALSCDPSLLIADEPTTALDVTIQAQILKLMTNIREGIDTSILFITHDLGVVAEVCDRVAVMYCGRIVEYGEIESIFRHPTHPYTRGLIDSIPNVIGPLERLISIEGTVPDPSSPPSGCKFSPRCKYADEKCRTTEPDLSNVGENHRARCWYPL